MSKPLDLDAIRQRHALDHCEMCRGYGYLDRNAGPLCPLCKGTRFAVPQEIAALIAEVERLRKAIESFGNNPAGFDWAVLGRIDDLETLLATIEKLLDTDEEVHWPQPHPHVLTCAAGTRLTLKRWAEEIKLLEAEKAALRAELAGKETAP